MYELAKKQELFVLLLHSRGVQTGIDVSSQEAKKMAATEHAHPLPPPSPSHCLSGLIS